MSRWWPFAPWRLVLVATAILLAIPYDVPIEVPDDPNGIVICEPCGDRFTRDGEGN